MPDTNTYDTEDLDNNSTQSESINKILEETKIAYIENHKNDFILAVTTIQLMASMYAGLIKNISLLMVNGLFKTDVFKDLFKSIVLRGLKLNHWRVQLCQFMPSVDTSYFRSMFQDREHMKEWISEMSEIQKSAEREYIASLQEDKGDKSEKDWDGDHNYSKNVDAAVNTD